MVVCHHAALFDHSNLVLSKPNHPSFNHDIGNGYDANHKGRAPCECEGLLKYSGHFSLYKYVGFLVWDAGESLCGHGYRPSPQHLHGENKDLVHQPRGKPWLGTKKINKRTQKYC